MPRDLAHYMQDIFILNAINLDCLNHLLPLSLVLICAGGRSRRSIDEKMIDKYWNSAKMRSD